MRSVRMKQYLIFICIFTLFVPALSYSQEASITKYTKAIEESPETMKYKFLNYRGKAYLKQGDINSAIADFSLSISLNPTKEAYAERGKIYFEKERYSLAINDFTKAIEINPSPELYKLRGKSYLAQNMYDEVIEDGTQLVNLEPDNSESYNLRLQAYVEAGRLDEALQDCSRALQLDSQNLFALAIKEIYTKKIILEGNPNASAGTSYATIDTSTRRSQDTHDNKNDSNNNTSPASNAGVTNNSATSNPCLALYEDYLEYNRTVTEWYGQNHSGITEIPGTPYLIKFRI
jgi:tetratricopeptide (TPR) repeat protein